MAGGAGGNAGGGYQRFSQLNAELQQTIASFAQLVTGASAFGATVAAFREFEKQLTLTNAAANGTIEQFEKMEAASRNFALATSASATEAASALFFLAQAGFSVNESLAAMTGVLVLSQATLTDVAFVSDVVASNIRAFGLEAIDTGRLTNVFAASMTNSLASIDKLAFAMRQVAPAAAALGANVEETTAYLSELFNIGLRGEQAGTQLRNIFVRLSAPVGDAADILRDYGIATTDATGEMREFRDILQDLGNANLTTPQLSAIAGIEGVAGLIALINAEMSGSLENMQNSITGTNRAFELFAQQLDTFDGSANLARNALNELLITVGESGAGILGPLALSFRDLVQDFRELDDATKSQITSWIAYSAIGLSVLGVLRGLIGLIGPVVSFTWGLVAGFIALFSATGPLVTAWTTIAGIFSAVSAAITGLLPLLSSMVTAIAAITGASAALVTGGFAALAAILVGGVAYGAYKAAEAFGFFGDEAEEAAARAQAAFDSVAGPEGSEFFNRSAQRTASIERYGEIAQNFSRQDEEGFTLAVNLQGGIRRAQEELDRVRAEFDRIMADSDETYLQMQRDYEESLNTRARVLQELSRMGENVNARGQLTDISFAEEFANELASRPGQDPREVRRIVQQNRDARLAAWNTQIEALRAEQQAASEFGAELLNDEGFRQFIEGMGIVVDERDSQIEQLNSIMTQFETKQREGIENALNALVAGDIDVSVLVQNNEESMRVFRDFVSEIMGEDTTESLLALVREQGGSFGIRSVVDFIRQQAEQSGRQDVIDALIDVEAERVRAVVLGVQDLERRLRDNLRTFETAYAGFQAEATERLGDIIRNIQISETNNFVSRISTDLEAQQREITAILGDQQVFSANILANLNAANFMTPAGLQIGGLDASRIAELQLSSGETVGSLLTFDNFLLEVRRAVDEGASKEQLRGMVQDQIDKVTVAIEVTIAQLGLAGEDADNLRTVGDLFARNLGGNVSFLFERIAEETENAETAAARDALRAQRSIEDAFARIDDIRATMRERSLELQEGRGEFDVAGRRTLEADQLAASLDAEIRQTARQIQDLELDPEANQELLEAMRELLLRQQEQRNALLEQARSEVALGEVDTTALDQSTADFSRQLAIQLAQSTAILEDTDEARIRAATLQERGRFIQVMRGIADDRRSAMQTAFGDYSNLLRNTVSAGIVSQVEGAQNFIGATLGDLLSFSPIISGIERMVDEDENASPEEIAAYAEAQAAMIIAVVNIYLEQLLAAGQIADEAAAQIRENLTNAAANLASAAASFGVTLGAAVSRAGSKGGGGGGDPAEEAKRLRRQYEDAFLELEGIASDAMRTQLRIANVNLDTRINFRLALDVNEIVRDYEEQLRGLRRELEDLNETFAGQPLELDRLSQAYSTVIAQVEAARDAEIRYTTGFTAMVQRRNEAITEHVNRLRDAAAEVSSLSFSMMAGLEAGLAMFQQDMLSVVDTVANAVVGSLDAIAASVGQSVTQGGSFIDILRQNLLSVLGQLAQQAVKGLLQSLVSTLTQNIGGVLGNALSGLMGGGAGMAGIAGMQAGMQAQLVAMQATLTSFNAGMTATFTSSNAQLAGTVTTFGIQFAAALQQAVAAVTAAAASAGGVGLFAGLFDDGGSIGAGQWGIVGEYGPEFVRGPASVIGRKDTARMMGAAAPEAAPTVVQPELNVTNIIVGSEQEARAYLNSTAGERQILNIIDRRTR
jgi:TP901 family phage tail tape measure protein